MAHPDQADLNWNHSRMNCRDCVQLILDVDGVDAIIDTQMLKNSHVLLVRLADLDYGRKPYIGTLKKDRGGYFQSVAQRASK